MAGILEGRRAYVTGGSSGIGKAIVEAFGGRVGFAGEVVHGKPARIEHDGSGPLAALPSPMLAARYHSLAALDVPPELRVTARTGAVVMAVQHVSAPIFGVQFHPESILTPHGGTLMAEVMRWAAEQEIDTSSKEELVIKVASPHDKEAKEAE